MRTAIVLAVLLGTVGCADKPSAQSTSPPTPQRTRVMVERYSAQESAHVPLGKCTAVVYPPMIKEIPSFLGLLQESLRKPPSLTPDDDIWVCLTPKNILSELDFVQPNDESKREDKTIELSLDFIRFAGPTTARVPPMSCVTAFHLGRLPAGDYKATVTNQYLEYEKVGKESDAKPVPKDRIHPDTFWYEIEFTVKDR